MSGHPRRWRYEIVVLDGSQVYGRTRSFAAARREALEICSILGEVCVHGITVDGQRAERLLRVEEDGAEHVHSVASAWQRYEVEDGVLC